MSGRDERRRASDRRTRGVECRRGCLRRVKCGIRLPSTPRQRLAQKMGELLLPVAGIVSMAHRCCQWMRKRKYIPYAPADRTAAHGATDMGAAIGGWPPGLIQLPGNRFL